MFRRGIFVASIVIGGAAHANDAPLIAPVPAWVQPVALPPAPKADGAAIQLLLSDQQIAFEPGRQTTYLDIAMKIQTPQGLEAGNVSFPWKPDTDDLIVHKLLIHRDGKAIDVLAAGQTFTVVRRETNLESATLDGVLTANIQPEGLQVGDVLEFAASVTSRDPVLNGHVETVAAMWNQAPITRAHLRMQWPSTVAMRLRQSGALPLLKPVKAGSTTSLELTLNNIEPVPGPKGAPLRYQLGRRVEASDFAGWADLAQLMAPLYAKAAVVPATGALADEVAKIRALTLEPKLRAQAALALVQDRIRYVALAMGAGGLVPTDAGVTWSRRYGDCKGKTALLLAILKTLEIDAVPVLVNLGMGDGIDQRLPTVGAFDHVLVRTTIAGKPYWMDGTRKGDTDLDRLTVPDVGWGLPLVPAAVLLRMAAAPLDKPTSETRIRIDAHAGLTVPAPITVEVVMRGDEAIGANASMANLTGDARDRALRAYWKGQYDFVEPSAVGATFDAKAGEQRLTMTGTAKMDWSSGWYETDGTGVGYKADFSRDPGPDRDAPFAVPYPYFSRIEETIQLPPGFPDIRPGGKGDVERTIAGIDYRRKVTLTGGVFKVEKTERSVVAEFAAKDAPAAQVTLREMAGDALYIRQPANYRPTEAELTVALKDPPKTAGGFVTRGNTLLDRGRYSEAIADFDAALAIEPKNAMALADRGIARVWAAQFDAAVKDLDAAAAIDPRNAVVFRGRGQMALMKEAPADAVAAFTTSLQLEPGNDFALAGRAKAYRALGKNDEALADARAVLAINPGWTEMYLLSANIYRGQGKPDKVLEQAAAVVAANPDVAYAHVVSGSIYAAVKHPAEAMKAFDRAVALQPDADAYISRALARDTADHAGKLADYDAALKLEPKSVDAIAGKAEVRQDAGDLHGAIAIYTSAMALQPGRFDLQVRRGIARVKAGDTAGGEKDFVAARATTRAPGELNNLCWIKATAGVALQSALQDCDAAVAIPPPSAAILDSRAFVLLRLDRIEEAIAGYDKALALNPTQGGSLFGRAVAWARKGEKSKSAADLASALKVSPDVQERFAQYGVNMP
jgi:tetratricopeptide (TPR) repeat protein